MVYRVSDNKKPARLEIVKWMDHCTSSGWRRLTEVEESTPAEVYSVGWVIGEDSKTINLCPSSDREMYGIDTLSIIKKCIIKRWKIKDPS